LVKKGGISRIGNKSGVKNPSSWRIIKQKNTMQQKGLAEANPLKQIKIILETSLLQRR